MFGQGEQGRESGRGGRMAGCSSQYVFLTDTHSYICHIWERYVWSGGSGESGRVQLPVCLRDRYTQLLIVIFGKGMFGQGEEGRGREWQGAAPSMSSGQIHTYVIFVGKGTYVWSARGRLYR